MSKEKSLEEMLDEFLESIQNRNNRELTEDKRNKLKKVLEVNFDFVSKDKEKFLNKFSPWHRKVGKELIEKFVGIVNNTHSPDDFSWLDILEKDEQWKKPWEKSNKEVKIKEEVTDQNKHVNMRYQIPTHFHGDIDNAIIFHCMENPRGYLGKWKDNQIDEEFAGVNLEGFYVKSASKRKEESETIKDIIEERYQIQDISYKSKSITKIIHSYTSPLARELTIMFDKFEDSDYKTYDFSKGSSDLEDYYYFKNYYKQLILEKDNNLEPFKVKENQDKALECANKICNLEIYPFSCAQPSLDKNSIGKKILENSELSRLSAYIVLRRIYMYLDECEQSKTNNKEEPQKPVFIFRKYDRAWEQLFKKIFKEVKVEDKYLEYLEDHFFYCQTGQQGGGITEGNVISVRDFKAWKNIYEKLKKLAFTEISELLLRVDIDKVNSQKAGD